MSYNLYKHEACTNKFLAILFYKPYTYYTLLQIHLNILHLIQTYSLYKYIFSDLILQPTTNASQYPTPYTKIQLVQLQFQLSHSAKPTKCLPLYFLSPKNSQLFDIINFGFHCIALCSLLLSQDSNETTLKDFFMTSFLLSLFSLCLSVHLN